MPSTVYRGDLAEVTMGRETGLVITAGAWGGLDVTASTSGDVTTLTFSNAATSTNGSDSAFTNMIFSDATTLKYPKGLLVGSQLRVKSASGNFVNDDYNKGCIYTIVENGGATIKVTPAMKATGASTDGDTFMVDALGTPTIDVGMTYNASAAASDESVLTDQFVGLAATVTLPETKTEIFRSHVVGVGRDVVVQAPQKISNEGGSLETMMHSARWMYYALGNEAVKVPSNITVVDDGTNTDAIGMGDSYIGLMKAGGNGAVSGSAPAVGDYIVVTDSTEVLTPYTDEEDTDNDATLEVTTFPSDSETQFRSVQRNEVRRVVALDTTNTYYRIYVDSPFDFDHANGKVISKIVLAANNATGSPHFETTDAAWGNIQNRQTRALFSMWRQPTFSLETSMRTRNVGSYSGEQTGNVPGGTADSQQLTRIYKGCKVKSWEMTADADAEVKLKVDFDALMCYTDTGRLENSNKGDRYTAHRMFENTASNKITRKTSGIAPNTEKPFFFYNGTITAFNTTMAQVTKFKVSGNNNTQTIYTVGAQPLAESRNSAGQSLEQVPFGGSRNPSLNVEGKVEYECSMEVIVTDPLLWHEFRTNREHLYDEPITLHLVKNGAGAAREEVRVIIDDYIISEAPMQIPDDKSPIKSELVIMPKHVKVVSHDALLHC